MRRIAVAAAVLLSLACGARQKVSTTEPGREGASPGAARPGTPRPGEILREYDLNHDGRIDLWTASVIGPDGKEVVIRKERDLDGDGKVDCWEEYELDGSLAKLTYDMDFDGKPDVTLFFEKDQLVRKAYAFGFDGVPHSFNIYEKGKLVRKERDTNGDGKIDTWEYWENGEIDRIGIDIDGDGQVDRWESRRTAQAPGSAPAPKE
jgi:hypothetical protein